MTYELMITISLAFAMFLAGILTQKGANAWEVHRLKEKLQARQIELNASKEAFKEMSRAYKEQINRQEVVIADLKTRLQTNKTFHCQPIQRHEDNTHWRELDFPNKGDRK